MSRIKIFLLILIVAVLSIVFIQNREPIALKFLCGDGGTAFCPQSRPLPLALWIALFTLAGAIASILIRTLNRYGYRNSGNKRAILDDELYPNQDKWQSKTNRRQQVTTSANDPTDTIVQDEFSATSNYEVKQEPQSIERSGSTYSYKYREAGEERNNNHDATRKTSTEPEIDPKTIQDDDEEDWI
ncbi:MAG: hypothetical protein AAGE84_31705 [Cyanobacteria bacterium P01_G01_bin.39]